MAGNGLTILVCPESHGFRTDLYLLYSQHARRLAPTWRFPHRTSLFPYAVRRISEFGFSLLITSRVVDQKLTPAVTNSSRA